MKRFALSSLLLVAGFVVGQMVHPLTVSGQRAENFRVLQRMDTLEILGAGVDCLIEQGWSRAEVIMAAASCADSTLADGQRAAEGGAK